MPKEFRDKDGKLLHMLVRRGEITDKRQDFSPDSEGLQVAAFRLGNGHTFKPHVHIDRPREIPRTQETWIILSGIVLVEYFDDDGEPVGMDYLYAGDATITFAGGHNYRVIQGPMEAYEVKLGPWVGVEQDKRIIDA